MAKFEKGRAKTGGRKKGTPNYTTRLIKEKFLHEMGEYVDSDLFHGDIACFFVILICHCFFPPISSGRKETASNRSSSPKNSAIVAAMSA